jgi:hypothetical protein
MAATNDNAPFVAFWISGAAVIITAIICLTIIALH